MKYTILFSRMFFFRNCMSQFLYFFTTMGNKVGPQYLLSSGQYFRMYHTWTTKFLLIRQLLQHLRHVLEYNHFPKCYKPDIPRILNFRERYLPRTHRGVPFEFCKSQYFV
ncbi:unnamed protein product [Tenebrio molitor]|nr:unnamed protein product [Tenebrio molitor]